MSNVPCQSHLQQSRARSGRKLPAIRRILVLAGAALALAGCGEAQKTAEELGKKAEAAVDAQAVADAVRSSIDEQAIEGAIKGAAAQAIREELGVAGTVVNEEALVSGIEKSVDVDSVTRAIGQAARDAAREAGLPAMEQKAAE